MSNTSALAIEYKRVIPAKFVTKRDGSPMHCMTCGTDLVLGQAFAATQGGEWHSYCGKCASSFSAQIAGLVQRVETLVTPLGEDVPAEVIAAVEAVTPAVEAVLAANAAPSVFLRAKTGLLGVRALIGVAKRAAKVDALSQDPLFMALTDIAATAGARDRDFASSLLAGWQRYGSLTERQKAAAERMVAKRDNGTAVVTATPGMYIATNGDVFKIYMTRNDRLGAKVLTKYQQADGTWKGALEYLTGGVRLVSTMLSKGEARLLTQDEAAAMGREYGFCCNCARYLDDDRSLVAGYGPVCAENNGWWYPSLAEAAAIMDRKGGE